MSRRNRPAVPDDSSRDLKRQEGIFLSTFALMLLVLVSSYLPLPLIVPIVLAVVLVTWTIAMYVKFHDFYKMRDRGQRTLVRHHFHVRQPHPDPGLCLVLHQRRPAHRRIRLGLPLRLHVLHLHGLPHPEPDHGRRQPPRTV